MLLHRLRAVVSTALLAVTLALTACASGEPTPTAAQSSSAPTPTVEPTFVPGGTAEQNQPWFDHINQKTLAQNDKASSREMVDALVVAGFDKAAMQVTFDMTSTGNDQADYIIVSVKIGNDCLIGQRSPRGYRSEVAAPIASTGMCLLGKTQPIDW